MAVAVFTASVSVTVAVMVFVLNQWGQARGERRQARLQRVNAQLRDLYGPLKALADANEEVWDAMRDSHLPDVDTRRSGPAVRDQDSRDWTDWLTHALMPTNRRMREVIVGNAHLLIEPELPRPLRAFCAHVAALEVALARSAGAGHGPLEPTLIHHPGRALAEYLDASYASLRQEQEVLIPGPRRGAGWKRRGLVPHRGRKVTP